MLLIRTLGGAEGRHGRGDGVVLCKIIDGVFISKKMTCTNHKAIITFAL